MKTNSPILPSAVQARLLPARRAAHHRTVQAGLLLATATGVEVAR
ncbi:hypothetical protein [Kitasatospora griseola]